jgi:16S rRNA (guanine527-N7)-methyltransferase
VAERPKGGWSGNWPEPPALAERIREVHGVIVEPAASGVLLEYLRLLERWAERFNLISARSRAEVAERHLIDSFGLVAVTARGDRVADVGSGAGFPGVPLAVARGDVAVLLVEPRRHRANFLREAVRRLGLRHAVVAESRAEAPGVLEWSANLVTGRAIRVEELGAVGDAVLPPGGRLVLMQKAGSPAFRPAGFELDRIHRYALSDGSAHEVAVLLRKCST